eukprot:3806852-Amphidinium_carterae.1
MIYPCAPCTRCVCALHTPDPVPLEQGAFVIVFCLVEFFRMVYFCRTCLLCVSQSSHAPNPSHARHKADTLLPRNTVLYNNSHFSCTVYPSVVTTVVHCTYSCVTHNLETLWPSCQFLAAHRHMPHGPVGTLNPPMPTGGRICRAVLAMARKVHFF